MRTLTARDEAIVQAARTECVLFGRDDLAAVTVGGRDGVKFLNAMLTQDIKTLPPAGAASACLCDAQGAIVATMLVVVHGDRTVLWTDRNRAQMLLDALDRFVIADDVALHVDDSIALCELIGPKSAEVTLAALAVEPPAIPCSVTFASQPVLTWRADLDASGSPWWPPMARVWLQLSRDGLGDVACALIDAGAQPGSHGGREAMRVLAGEPRLGLDVDDGSLPLEVGLGGTVSFRKGCYLGQEAIAMMKYRGQPRRYLAWVVGEGTPVAGVEPGWQLRTAEGKRAGRLGTCVVGTDGSWRALAVVQRKALAIGAAYTAVSEDGGSRAQVTLVASTVPEAAAAADSQGASA